MAHFSEMGLSSRGNSVVWRVVLFPASTYEEYANANYNDFKHTITCQLCEKKSLVAEMTLLLCTLLLTPPIVYR